ncbi:hypothetical protein BUALT_Bualt12G0098100 [Buddleja alternifolia]|uniref:Uncharacterized protein n=1 Tax=Buddleja alternifolia TaxID=168488 RepID=A0AAV6WY02_9LAMI|nr:hypothetical protein BUALT_Bualt12G0098100 [Buddleja alternifolia]
MPEIPVIVEDVTDTVPPGDPSSSAKPHIQGGHNVYGIESHGGETETETETVIYESEDDVEDGDDNKDESISDAAIIEMEAGIYGLQIIKNADLEDLQSRIWTFGTYIMGSGGEQITKISGGRKDSVKTSHPNGSASMG